MKYLGTKIIICLIIFFYSLTSLQLMYGDINIPVSDFFAMILGLIFLFVVIGEYFLSNEFPRINTTGIASYSLFILTALISIKNASSVSECVKFLFRMPVFYYSVYFVAIGTFFIWFDKKTLHKFYHFFCISSLLIALLSIITSIYRMSMGIFWGILEIPFITNNHKSLAVTLAGNISFLIAMSLNVKKHVRFFYYVSIVVCLIAIILSCSKAAWMTVVIILGLWGVPKLNRQIYLKPILVIFFILIIISTGAYIYLKLSLEKEVVSAEKHRYVLAWYAVQSFMNYPVLGNGIGSFTLGVKDLNDSLKKCGYHNFSELDAHGLVFKLLSETGCAGFLTFSLFYLSIVLSVYRNYKIQKYRNPYWGRLFYGCFTTLVSIYFINSFFGTDTYNPRLWFPLAFISAHLYLTPKIA
ncbi:MAG: hypothetical protein HZA78_03360 [Candidatus Schekmanbacteria bacterium]|nr:hypothetical protein [Candidatus Schekmanbacteria bacterium]